ncbi:MAG: hypothetical protein ABIH11_07095 [Candidatus Altiarchaeota archaeon]
MMLPKTKEGFMQLEFTLVGIVVSTLVGAAFLIGMKIGYEYGLMH